jgi:hypothetical protein
MPDRAPHSRPLGNKKIIDVGWYTGGVEAEALQSSWRVHRRRHMACKKWCRAVVEEPPS